MAELSTYIGIEPRTAYNASGSTIGRGLRVTLNASGQIVLAGAGVRGDYVTLQDIENNAAGLVVSCQGGGKVAMSSSGTFNIGDLVYAAANGQVGTTNTNPLIGRATQAATSGTLFEVEQFNPA